MRELLRVLPRPTVVRLRLVPFSVLALLVAVLPVLVACSTGRSSADLPHPTGHDDVVLRLTEGPGMGTAQTFFTQPPVLVLTGDGTAWLRGEEVTDQGIVWPVFRFRARDADVQALLHEAGRGGLLASPPDYAAPSPIADGGDTTVAITAGGGTWTHRANGLGDATRESGARGRLAAFVAYLGGWGRTPHQPRAREIRPTALRVLAQPTPAPPDEPVDAWPADAAVHLEAVGDCAVVRDPVAVHRLTTSDTRYYRQAGQTYAVAAAVLLPGDSCAPGAAS